MHGQLRPGETRLIVLLFLSRAQKESGKGTVPLTLLAAQTKIVPRCSARLLACCCPWKAGAGPSRRALNPFRSMKLDESARGAEHEKPE